MASGQRPGRPPTIEAATLPEHASASTVRRSRTSRSLTAGTARARDGPARPSIDASPAAHVRWAGLDRDAAEEVDGEPMADRPTDPGPTAPGPTIVDAIRGAVDRLRAGRSAVAAARWGRAADRRRPGRDDRCPEGSGRGARRAARPRPGVADDPARGRTDGRLRLDRRGRRPRLAAVRSGQPDAGRPGLDRHRGRRARWRPRRPTRPATRRGSSSARSGSGSGWPRRPRQPVSRISWPCSAGARSGSPTTSSRTLAWSSSSRVRSTSLPRPTRRGVAWPAPGRRRALRPAVGAGRPRPPAAARAGRPRHVGCPDRPVRALRLGRGGRARRTRRPADRRLRARARATERGPHRARGDRSRDPASARTGVPSASRWTGPVSRRRPPGPVTTTDRRPSPGRILMATARGRGSSSATTGPAPTGGVH